MKILFCTMQFGPGYNQGTERYIRNLARELVVRGCEVVVAGGNPEGVAPEEEHDEDGLQRITLPTYGWAALEGIPLDQARELLERAEPDIVHFVNPGHIGVNLAVMAREMEIPYLVSVTDFWWLCPKHTLTLPDGKLCGGFEDENTCLKCIARTHPKPAIRAPAQVAPVRPLLAKLIQYKHRSSQGTLWENRRELLAGVLRQASSVICLSKTGERLLKDYYALENCQYIPAGLSSIWFEDKPQPIQKNDGEFTVGFLGAIAPHKGLHVLTKALCDLDDRRIKLKIAGKAANSRYAKRESSRYKNASYLGHLSETESRNLIDSLDAIILPSLWPENQPQVLLEAGARKIPVIASDTPGCSELLSAQAVFPMGNQKSLGKILQTAARQKNTIPTPPPAMSASAVAECVIQEYRK